MVVSCPTRRRRICNGRTSGGQYYVVISWLQHECRPHNVVQRTHAAMHVFDVFVVYARVALVGYEFDSDCVLSARGVGAMLMCLKFSSCRL